MCVARGTQDAGLQVDAMVVPSSLREESSQCSAMDGQSYGSYVLSHAGSAPRVRGSGWPSGDTEMRCSCMDDSPARRVGLRSILPAGDPAAILGVLGLLGLQWFAVQCSSDLGWATEFQFAFVWCAANAASSSSCLEARGMSLMAAGDGGSLGQGGQSSLGSTPNLAAHQACSQGCLWTGGSRRPTSRREQPDPAHRSGAGWLPRLASSASHSDSAQCITAPAASGAPIWNSQ